MGKVHFLNGTDAIIARLEEYIERAKRGEIDAIAIAAQVQREGVGTTFILGRNGNVWMLLGAIEELKDRIMDGTDEMTETKE